VGVPPTCSAQVYERIFYRRLSGSPVRADTPAAVALGILLYGVEGDATKRSFVHHDVGGGIIPAHISLKIKAAANLGTDV
jgi:hypothetical protein